MAGISSPTSLLPYLRLPLCAGRRGGPRAGCLPRGGLAAGRPSRAQAAVRRATPELGRGGERCACVGACPHRSPSSFSSVALLTPQRLNDDKKRHVFFEYSPGVTERKRAWKEVRRWPALLRRLLRWGWDLRQVRSKFPLALPPILPSLFSSLFSSLCPTRKQTLFCSLPPSPAPLFSEPQQEGLLLARLPSGHLRCAWEPPFLARDWTVCLPISFLRGFCCRPQIPPPPPPPALVQGARTKASGLCRCGSSGA